MKMRGHRHETVLLLQFFSIAVYLILANAHVCEVGREKDKNDKWMWVLPYDKPCLCTQIVIGGMNTWTPIRPFQPIYVKSPLLSDNVTKIRRHYKLRCKEEGVTQSMTMSASLEAALSSTALGNVSEKISSQTAAKLSTFVSLFSTNATKSSTDQAATSNTATKKASTSAATATTAEQVTAVKSNTATKKASTSAATATTAEQESTACKLMATTETSVAKQGCVEVPLGMESGKIPDSSITASSFQQHSHFDRQPRLARLGQNQYWANNQKTDAENPWIQVDLGNISSLTGLQTEGYRIGNGGERYFVSQLNVQVGMSEQNLRYIADNCGRPKMFNANTDPEVIANISLDINGILTRFVRIYPVECKKGNNKWDACILRFEIMGCEDSNGTG